MTFRSYIDELSPLPARDLTQVEPLPGENQVKNNAGGYVFELTPWDRLDRFLVIGADSNTYYQSARALTLENAECVRQCLAQDPSRTINQIAEVSRAGRAPKNDPAIFALALAASDKGPEWIRDMALSALPVVCRTGTHLFQFVEACDRLRGWGRQLRRGVGEWYLNKGPKALAYQMLKYQQRNGWNHRDVLRLAHPSPKKPVSHPDEGNLHQDLFYWAVKGWPEIGEEPHPEEALQQIWAFETLKRKPDDKELACKLIREYRLTREMVPNQLLTSPEVWAALLEDMPMTALVRNLATLTRIGLVTPLGQATHEVCRRITDPDSLRRSKIHPFSLLTALGTYRSGYGHKGSNQWIPVSEVVDALDSSFYLAFENVEPTGKRLILAIDISGSMDLGTIGGTSLKPREAAAAMALVTAAVEPRHLFLAYTSNYAGNGYWGHAGESTVTPLDISPKMRLTDVVDVMKRQRMGSTDCALPFLYALEKGLEVDGVISYTDNETWAGKVHVKTALETYRKKSGIPARAVAVGMTATNYSILPEDDAGCLNVAGLDADGPALIADFMRKP